MPKTYNDVYLDARKLLKAEGISAYSLEARLLVSAASGKTKEDFVRDQRLYVSDEFPRAVVSMTARRLEGEPLAYITGNWEFYGLPFDITKDVLIPRTDSEVLANTAVTRLRSKESGTRILDLCAGSGCIGIAVAANVPQSRLVLADNSKAALKVCRSNVSKNNLTARVTCVEADALATPPMIFGNFDMLICNPPYIKTADITNLDKSVRDYEPVSALDGGSDGLEFYRAVTEKWKRVLRDDGLLLFECGEGQSGDVMAIMAENGFDGIETIKDTIGIDRVIFGRKT